MYILILLWFEQSSFFFCLLKWCYRITSWIQQTFIAAFQYFLPQKRSTTFIRISVVNIILVLPYLLTKRLRCHQNWLFMVLLWSYCVDSSRKKNHDVCHTVICYRFSIFLCIVFALHLLRLAFDYDRRKETTKKC